MYYIKYLSPQKFLSQIRPKFCDLPLASLAREKGFDVKEGENQYEKISLKTNWKEEFPEFEIPKDPVKFWCHVLHHENAIEENCYKELAVIALNSYCIPLSTSFVERVFSHVTNVKTKTRNKLSTGSLEAILRVRTHLHRGNCYQSFTVRNKMLALFNSNMYRKESIGECSASGSSSAPTSAVPDGDEDNEVGSYEETLSIQY
ncbi:uncharacterized protein LOC122244344 [Penaeus japonicus]|uniref:uncharacterized protein LOC122244344 n=1 Tax=Penaeus japonicus TaxID=27405 RepID=UPI001C7165A3|nr:uncharacterized protein LOC122244344 [Penaeus japonicus]